ncbi:PKD domain-containing protein, partial [Microbacterium wangruii]|uniref:PKD domain-containing protein n=1 Tax=Microbacterium wangruii TaxID=3049073 RepID=UPI00256F54F4
PANVAPVAVFTSAVSGLSVSVDGSGSSDADGSIASYAWDFGDGGTGAGATASHAFAAAGTYTVRLTVTDNGGAAATTTAEVTVAAPVEPPAGQLFADAFGRTVASGWGSADVGGAWTLRTGANRFAVADGVGRITMPGSSTVNVDSAVIDSTSTSFTGEFAVDKINDAMYIGLIARRVGDDQYMVRIRTAADGSARLNVLRGGSTAVGAAVETGVVIEPGAKYLFRVDTKTAAGVTTISAKVWKDGTPEPGWQVERTNNVAGLQAPGSVGVYAFVPNAATRVPVTLTFDNLQVVNPDSVVVPPVDPPANVAPVAVFTSAVSGLSVSVDGSGSSDADGSIASYAWDFGDGGTGAGATASHAFAAAGTYTVRLTVTDNGGAAATTTAEVTVAAPVEPPAGQLFADAFGRTVASGWGSADVGGAWTLRTGANRFAVADGVGRITMPGSSTVNVDSAVIDSTSTSFTGEFAVDKINDAMYIGLIARRVGDDQYMVRIRTAADGSARLNVLRGGSTAVGAAVETGVVIEPGAKYLFRVDTKTAAGVTTISAKVWKDGTPEPGWQVERTNNVAGLQAPGSVGVYAFVPNAATRVPVTLTFDNLQVNALP